jgi:hypothetical protein
MSSEFFKKLQPLFESSSTQTNDLDKQSRGVLAKKDGAKALAGVKKKVNDEYGSNKNKDPKTNKTEDGEEVYESKPASNVKETAGEFFRRYSDMISEAEGGPKMTEEAAAEKINQIIMQAVKQAAASKAPQVKESVVNEGILQKIMPIVAAVGIGLGAMGAASAQQNGQEWQSREQTTNSSGQTFERECTNRAQQVADLVNQYGHVLQSHTEIIKQCGPYILTGQRIEVRDNNVANILIGVLGVAAVIHQNNQHQQQHQQHGGYEQRNYGNQGTYSNGNYKGNQGPGGHRDAGGFYPYGGYRR